MVKWLARFIDAAGKAQANRGRRSRWPRAAAAGLLFLAVAAPAGAGLPTAQYRNDRLTLRAGVFTAPGSGDWATICPAYGRVFMTMAVADLPVEHTGDSVTFHFSTGKPAQWEFANPLAAPGLAKTQGEYWRVPAAVAPIVKPMLDNYDILLAPVYDSWVPNSATKAALMEWVQEGGLLWLDYCVGSGGQIGHLLLEPPPQFALPAPGPVTKVAADPTSLLLSGRFTLGIADVNLLGVQEPYATNHLGVSGAQGFSSGISGQAGIVDLLGVTSLPTLLTEVVRTSAGVPVVAAGRYGRGGILVTACGSAQAIGQWSLAYSLGTAAPNVELPEWSLPDLKLAYNAIEWWLSPAGETLDVGNSRERGGAPLTEVSRVAVPDVTEVPVPSGGAQAATVWQKVAYFGDHDGYVYAVDVCPPEDRDGDGNPDDGIADWSAGGTADVIWRYRLPAGHSVAGRPALGTIFDPAAGRARPMIAFTTHTADNSQCLLWALWADDITSPPPDGYPYTLRSSDWAEQVLGRVVAGPSILNGMIFLIGADTTDNPSVPVRDCHLVVFDPLYPGHPAIHLELAQSGSVMTSSAPPAMGLVTVSDQVAHHVTGAWSDDMEAEALVWAGNAMPRTATSATGRLWMTMPMVRVVLPNWDGKWLLNPAAQDDRAANQSVVVSINGVQVPPHIDDDPTKPLNYVRRYSQNQVEIVFTRWSFFRYYERPAGGSIDRRMNWGDFEIAYHTTEGEERTVASQPAMGIAAPLNMAISEDPANPPVVAGDTVYVAGSAVNGYPGASFYGGITAVQLGASNPPTTKWQFTGIRRAADTGTANRYYSFPYPPTLAGDMLLAAGNLVFTQALDESGKISYADTGEQGVVYCLDTECPDELRDVTTGLPGLGVVDYQAPLGQSADPNGAAPVGQRGIPASLALSTGELIPPRTGVANNWWMDYNNSCVRMSRQATGRYYYDIDNTATLTYFSGGNRVTTGPLYLPRFVVWQHTFAAGERVVGPPATVGDDVFVATQDSASGDIRLYAFRRQLDGVTHTTTRDAARAPHWSTVLMSGWPQLERPVVLTPAGSYLLANLDSAENGGYLLVLGQERTVIADNNRLLGVDSTGQATWSLLSTVSRSPRDVPGSLSGLPEFDTYADRVNVGFDRPSRVRLLPGGHMLAADTGHNRVVEVDDTGQVVWQYPDSDIANAELIHDATLNADLRAELMAPNPEEERLLAPTDVHRYVTQTTETIGGSSHEVRWETTLIADSGNYRIIEVVRPLVDGRYDPTAGGADPEGGYRQTVQVLAGPATVYGDTGRRTDPLMYTTACRIGTQTDPVRSTNLLVSASNGSHGLMQVAVTYNAGLVSASSIPAGAVGHSMLAPRSGVADDFVEIRQADVLSTADNPQIVVVDRHGVKVLRPADWAGGPIVELTVADYQAEMSAVRSALETSPPAWLDAAIVDAARAYAAAPGFHPVYAQVLGDLSADPPSGRLLVVNTFGAPYGAVSPGELAGPTKSEVFEYDPLRAVGSRIFDLESGYWEHFIVPDPFGATYPLVGGTSSGLKQPLAVERR